MFKLGRLLGIATTTLMLQVLYKRLLIEYTFERIYFYTVKAREDLAKLQRQFRLTEGSRKQYADQATNTLRKQQYVKKL